MKNLCYFAAYKPYGMISQFTPECEGDITLSSLFSFPSDVYPVGRLDKDSEGLLILTNDPKINSTILNPLNKCVKTYWVQVDGNADDDFIKKISQGVKIKLKDKFYNTLPCEVKVIQGDIKVPERNPPVRIRKQIPTTWLEIKLKEGKNRQIRKMCSSLGHPVLRIIRIAVGNLNLGNLLPGETKPLSRPEIFAKIDINNAYI
ncbi:MAG TPA: pseudouridine synthase [Saprospiraceae bacterium]|nr:pseudouridine synthase [Saprospiraceae bacterium]